MLTKRCIHDNEQWLFACTRHVSYSPFLNFPCTFILEVLVGTAFPYENIWSTSGSPADRPICNQFWMRTTPYQKKSHTTLPFYSVCVSHYSTEFHLLGDITFQGFLRHKNSMVGKFLFLPFEGLDKNLSLVLRGSLLNNAHYLFTRIFCFRKYLITVLLYSPPASQWLCPNVSEDCYSI
jgi:hypothetical protein